MSEVVCIDEFREGPSRHSPNLRYEIRVGEEWVQWVGWSVPALLNDAVIHTDRNGWRYATPVPDEPEHEPIYSSLKVPRPPRIVEYRTVISQDITELDAAVNALLADGWQPHMDQHVRGPMVWQVMVKCATSGTEPDQ